MAQSAKAFFPGSVGRGGVGDDIDRVAQLDGIHDRCAHAPLSEYAQHEDLLHAVRVEMTMTFGVGESARAGLVDDHFRARTLEPRVQLRTCRSADGGPMAKEVGNSRRGRELIRHQDGHRASKDSL